MGISNLLPQLKSIADTTTLHQFKGKTVAVDGYVWLHRGAYSCSQELCLGQDTDRYIGYFMERVDLLVKCGIIPYIVFDGGYLPMKKLKEDERRTSREKHRDAGLHFLKSKKFDMARQSFVKAVDVSPYMAHRVIQRLKHKGIQYVVAPYEADAQMAYLVRMGIVDAVISEDSDCLPFGCKTVLFKLDAAGNVDVIETANLAKNSGLSFVGFTDDMFLDMCILSGCDYVASIPGLGIKKSHGLVLRYGGYQKVIRALRLEGKLSITATYETDVAQARLTFRHQRVYDPVTQTLTHVTPLPHSLDTHDTDFLGPVITNELARGIAEGDVDPISTEPFPTVTETTTQLLPGPNARRPAPIAATPIHDLAPPTASNPSYQTPPQSQEPTDKENAFTRLLQAGSLMPRSTLSKRKLPATLATVPKRRPALHPIENTVASKESFFQPRSRYFGGSLSIKADVSVQKVRQVTGAPSRPAPPNTRSLPCERREAVKSAPSTTSITTSAPPTPGFSRFRFQG
ncbi:hypothetical protein H310_03988 [Aphanomyces invadans]|uniref:Uncharacterized protein n=1 Tax=Aphanomyces invadans TaxID=157072 RepID=A0A024UER0_9STRA|nr:hypothetical protein H310_03988 [Aphanomyces invadans]ETW04876.1 hypothetical protein H310_03988 [Aphanomyces invadans]|eukprot:XP_008866314.1 hypothetical protein H310_03988 [Aphanomyces invadans]